MRTFFTSILLLLIVAAKAQQPVFPAAWVGTWKGQLETASTNPNAPGLGTVDVVMEIAPISGTKDYTWKTTYNGAIGTIVKDYKLLADSVVNHYKLDEGDGIILDSYWLGNKLFSVFEVGDMTFFSYYEMQGKKLVSEISFGPSKPVRTSGSADGGMVDEASKVKSFELGNLQRIVFEKQK